MVQYLIRQENPGLGFLPIHLPRLLRMHVQAPPTPDLSDLWPRGYRKANQMDRLHVFFIYGRLQ